MSINLTNQRDYFDARSCYQQFWLVKQKIDFPQGKNKATVQVYTRTSSCFKT